MDCKVIAFLSLPAVSLSVKSKNCLLGIRSSNRLWNKNFWTFPWVVLFALWKCQCCCSVLVGRCRVSCNLKIRLVYNKKSRMRHYSPCFDKYQNLKIKRIKNRYLKECKKHVVNMVALVYVEKGVLKLSNVENSEQYGVNQCLSLVESLYSLCLFQFY